MCGIVGYVGKEQAAPILLDGLSKLEYRGYDSAGMAVFDGKKIVINKSTGRLKVLSELTHDGANMPGHIGIGHTRWATHGEPSEINAHPHFKIGYRAGHYPEVIRKQWGHKGRFKRQRIIFEGIAAEKRIHIKGGLRYCLFSFGFSHKDVFDAVYRNTAFYRVRRAGPVAQ